MRILAKRAGPLSRRHGCCRVTRRSFVNWLANFLEIAVASQTVLEVGRSGDAIFDQRLAPIVPFLDQRLAHAKAVTPDGRAAVGASADLWKARDLLSKFLGFLS